MTAREADFDAFYAGTAARVIHLVYAWCGDLDLAQDCTQEAYLRAWQRWDQVRSANDPLAWVRTVARRLVISQWRSRRSRARTAVRYGPPSQPAQPSEDHVAVVAALRKLPEAQREAVVLHYIADLSIDQIAAETQTPAGTIKARLYRGRAQLAKELSEEGVRHG